MQPRPPPDPESENPDLLTQDGASDGIEAQLQGIFTKTGYPNGYPDFYSPKFEATLSDVDRPKYWKHLRGLGYAPKKDNQQRVIDWIKI